MSTPEEAAVRRPGWISGRLLFHRLMLPNWLRDDPKVQWDSPKERNDLELIIKPDASDWENIFRVRLIPSGKLADDADITVKIKVGVVLPQPQQQRDPMSYMISDDDFSIGIQLLDRNHDYATYGPYRAVERGSAKKLLNPNTEVAATVSSTSRNNPDQFELTIKPSETFSGSAYCAIDDGHKIVAQYSKSLKLSKGLWFEMYRDKSNEEYTINYIEMTVYEDSKPC